MRRAIVVISLAVLTFGLVQVPASAAPMFRNVVATTEGPSLLITFTEGGLQPGQNYAYTGDGTVSETFQCYRTRTFTPMPRTKTITAGVLPDPRSYVANANGVVRGFIYLWPDIAYPNFCGAPPVGGCRRRLSPTAGHRRLLRGKLRRLLVRRRHGDLRRDRAGLSHSHRRVSPR